MTHTFGEFITRVKSSVRDNKSCYIRQYY